MKLRLLLFLLILNAAGLAAKAGTTRIYNSNCISGKKCIVGGGVLHSSTKKPLSNVVVTAWSMSKKEKVVFTDDNGNYNLNDLKPGMYKLVFEKEGYKKVVKSGVVVKQDEGCQLNVEMVESGDFQIMPGQLFITDFD